MDCFVVLQVVSNLIGEDTLLGVDFRAEVSGLQSVPLPVQSLAVWQMTGLFLTGLEALMLHGKDVVDEIEASCSAMCMRTFYRRLSRS